MNEYLFEDVLIGTEPVQRHLRDFLLFYTQDKFIFSNLKNSFSDQVLYSPSPFSKNRAVCVGCFFSRFNFLKFRDGSSFFYMVQHHHYCIALWFSDTKTLVSQNHSVSKVMFEKLDLIDEKLGGETVPVPFLGVLNGYGRPYHYFYDRAPSLKAYIEGVGRENIKVIDLVSSAFLRGEDLSSEELDVIQVHDHDEIFGCYINPSFPVLNNVNSVNVVRNRWRSDFDEWLRCWALRETSWEVSVNIPKIWIGVAQEKRKFGGLLATIQLFLVSVFEKYPNAMICFDGLTKPSHLNEIDFAKKAKLDGSFIDEVLNGLVDSGVNESRLRAQILNFSGKSAEEKLIGAAHIDFFVSSALTDSMWCAKFSRVQGVCWSNGNVKKIIKEHEHPFTYFLLPGAAYQVEGEYSKEKYFFNPELTAKLLLELFEISLANSKDNFIGLAKRQLISQ